MTNLPPAAEIPFPRPANAGSRSLFPRKENMMVWKLIKMLVFLVGASALVSGAAGCSFGGKDVFMRLGSGDRPIAEAKADSVDGGASIRNGAYLVITGQSYRLDAMAALHMLREFDLLGIFDKKAETGDAGGGG